MKFCARRARVAARTMRSPSTSCSDRITKSGASKPRSSPRHVMAKADASSLRASGQSLTLRIGVTPWSDMTPPMRSTEPSVQLAMSARLPAACSALM
jgi:hypothetical protein